VLSRASVTAVVVFGALSWGLGAQSANGTIAWLFAHEPVGKPVPQSLLQGQSVKVKFLYERLITFDAAAGLKMVVSLREGPDPFGILKPTARPSSRWVCWVAWAPLSTGTGCTPASGAFAHGPLALGFGGVSGDTSVHGIASDEVKQILLTLASGKVVEAPLVDNAFLFRASSSDLPMVVRAYNASGTMIERRSL
jgi:hypothetical protein